MKIQPQPQEKRHKGYKTIRFPIDETQYDDFLHDRAFARTYLDDALTTHREIFPEDIEEGFVFNGFTEVSAKLGLRQRRIRLKATGAVFTLAPAFVLPYMRGKTDTVATDQTFLGVSGNDTYIDAGDGNYRFEDTGGPLVTPVHAGRRRAPVLVARRLFDRMARISGDEGGRQIFAELTPQEIVEMEMTDGRALEDVDRLEDLRRLR